MAEFVMWREPHDPHTSNPSSRGDFRFDDWKYEMKGNEMDGGLVNRLLTEVTVGTGRVTHLRKEAADRIEELEAKIKAYMEAAADAAGGAPDKYAEEQRAFIALRCAVNWPTPASCATLEALTEIADCPKGAG